MTENALNDVYDSDLDLHIVAHELNLSPGKLSETLSRDVDWHSDADIIQRLRKGDTIKRTEFERVVGQIYLLASPR
jgi:hypothetical protein